MRSNLILTLLASLLVGLGCDRHDDSAKKADEPATKTSSTGNFTWRDALESTPKDASSALGTPTDCTPEKRLPSLSPTNRQFWLGGVPFCRFEDASGESGDAYRIAGILYSESVATMVELEPSQKTEVSEVLEAFALPDFEVGRRSQIGQNDKRRNVIELRPRTYEPREHTVVGVDVVTEPDTPDVVELVRVAAFTKKWPSVISFVEIDEPPTASTDLVLPATTSGLYPSTQGLHASVGVDETIVTTEFDFPRKSGEESEQNRGLVALDTREVRDRSDKWSKAFGGLVEQWRNEQKLLGQKPVGAITLAADRTLPASTVIAFLETAATEGIERFEVLGREVETLSEPFSPYGNARKTNVIFAPDISNAAGRTRSDLRLRVTTDGIDIAATGAMLPPVSGCSTDGPTLCLVDDSIDLDSQIQKARDAQRAADFEASEAHIRKALSAYDWPGLYAKLARVKELYPSDNVITMVVGNETPYAAVARAMEVSRFKRAAADGCATEFDDNKTLMEAKLCRADGRRVQPLFPNIVLMPDR